MQKNKLYQQFSIIPLDGKSPINKSWTKYCHERIDFSKIENHTGNIGICCGFEGLEVVDIDNHFLDADELFGFVSDNYDLKDFLIIKTGGGGYHLYFRSDFCGNNQIFARRMFIENDETKHVIKGDNHIGILLDGKETKLKKEGDNWQSAVTIVESRGIGGQVVFYDNILQGSIDSIVKLSSEERDDLLSVCRSLNEVETVEKKKIHEETKPNQPGTLYNNDLTSINETIKLLRQNGWTSKDDKYWTRPGKNKGISATFGKVGINKFYNFSSNASPFKAMESYTMFGVKTELEEIGDFSACAKTLAKKYANVLPEKKEQLKTNEKWAVLKSIIEDWNLIFRFNEMTDVFDVSVKGKKFERVGLLLGDIMHEMEVNRGVKTISTAKINEMISSKQICITYNPVDDFFKKLPKWDGNENFKKLCEYIDIDEEEDRDYFCQMLKKHICRCVLCALNPNYVNRIVLVFHGVQEIGKSMFFRWLLKSYPELYNEEPVSPNDKDSILALTRYLILNLDELDNLNRKDVAHLKTFISRGQVTKRVAYGRHDENFPRIASFVGSTNKTDILNDENNTRWIILKVKNFNWREYVKNIDAKQLWAEAYAAIKQNEEAGELTLFEKQKREQRNNDAFLETNSEREILMKHFEKGEAPLTATEIKFTIETKLFPIKIILPQLIRELYRLFGKPMHTKVDGKQGKYYYLKTDLVQAPGFEQMYEPYQERIEKLPF
jgi:hypothetical protein